MFLHALQRIVLRANISSVSMASSSSMRPWNRTWSGFLSCCCLGPLLVLSTPSGSLSSDDGAGAETDSASAATDDVDVDADADADSNANADGDAGLT